MENCRICPDVPAVPWFQEKERYYLECPSCRVIFLGAPFLPDRAGELSRYLKHRNDPLDPAYRRFLSRAVEPLARILEPGSSGLDYGCGPGPALAMMLEDSGFSMALYDPFFFPEKKVLEKRYDFITCTEAAEHFHAPAVEFILFNRLLKPAGRVLVMTSPPPGNRHDFARWHYRQDPTHVIFYRPETFLRIAEGFSWKLEIPGPGVFMMTR